MLLAAWLVAAAEGFAPPCASRSGGGVGARGATAAAPRLAPPRLEQGKPRPQAYTQSKLLGSPKAEAGAPASKVPFIFDIGTKGGIVFYTILGIVLPFFLYNWLLDSGWSVVAAGNVVLVGYVGLLVVGWTSTYVFRVANKGMTYAQQLRDYEDAVIQKRYDELNTEEVDALMGEIYPGGTRSAPKAAPEAPAGPPAAPPPDA